MLQVPVKLLYVRQADFEPKRNPAYCDSNILFGRGKRVSTAETTALQQVLLNMEQVIFTLTRLISKKF